MVLRTPTHVYVVRAVRTLSHIFKQSPQQCAHKPTGVLCKCDVGLGNSSALNATCIGLERGRVEKERSKAVLKSAQTLLTIFDFNFNKKSMILSIMREELSRQAG